MCGEAIWELRIWCLVIATVKKRMIMLDTKLTWMKEASHRTWTFSRGWRKRKKGLLNLLIVPVGLVGYSYHRHNHHHHHDPDVECSTFYLSQPMPLFFYFLYHNETKERHHKCLLNLSSLLLIVCAFWTNGEISFSSCKVYASLLILECSMKVYILCI